MPTGPIVADNYIDDPNRTTEEVQDALNQNFDYLRSMQAELGALSSTVLREASVRSIGNSNGNVPDKAVIDSRLGTTGNLGNAATKTTGSGNGLDADKLDGLHGYSYLKKSDYNPASPTLVWSGSSTNVSVSSLSESGAGTYIAICVAATMSLYVLSTASGGAGTVGSTYLAGAINFTFSMIGGSSPSFRIMRSDASNGFNFQLQTITQIYKV